MESVAISDFRPLLNSMTVTLRKPGELATLPAKWESVTPTYFDLMRTRLLEGRLLTRADGPGAPAVAILSKTAARRCWPGETAVGREIEIQFAGEPLLCSHCRSRCGRPSTLDRESAGTGCLRSASAAPIDAPRHLARLAPGVPMSAVVPAIRTEMAAVDPAIAADNVTGMDAAVAETLAQPRFMTALFAVYAALALALTFVGVFGVLSQSVRRRTYEFGVRIALGATPASVIATVLKHAVIIAVTGGLIGAAVALAASRTLSSYLYEVKPTDPWTFTAVAFTLAVVALVACAAPIRRVLRVDPCQILRDE